MMRHRIALASVVAIVALPAGVASATRSCGYVANIKIKANSNTSCPFARNIARSFRTGVLNGRIDPIGDSTASGNTYSPVTGQNYYVRCTHLSGSYTYAVWGCYAGNNAYARLTYYT
jgi:hypothetical protein